MSDDIQIKLTHVISKNEANIGQKWQFLFLEISNFDRGGGYTGPPSGIRSYRGSNNVMFFGNYRLGALQKTCY